MSNRGTKEIHIVTGFFDCGRGSRSSQSRSNQQYFDFFRFWARLRNHMVIYVSPGYEDEVRSIRAEFGLESHTDIVVVENIYNIESDLLEKMRRVSNNKIFSRWRLRENDISNDAEYDYIMLMKYWMMNDAVSRGIIRDGMVAWMDFGWNHGGQVFTKPEEFDFNWEYPFENSINLFSLKDTNSVNGFIQLQFMNDSIMGAMIVTYYEKIELLYSYCKEALRFLLAVDCIDDDQMLLYIASKLHPEDFNIILSDWYLPIKEYGNEKLTTRKPEIPKRSLLKRGLSFLIRILKPSKIIITRDGDYYSIAKRYKEFTELGKQ